MISVGMRWPTATARRSSSSTHPARLFTRNQAITALTLAERLAIGFGGGDQHVIARRENCSSDRPTHLVEADGFGTTPDADD